ncbi:MAG: hypothetical protein GWN58_57690, partial [Anaerolineae bacterium]|nr:hypothetical protein [Anaerolineae bacterium]
EFQADNLDIQIKFVSSDEASGLQQQGSTVTSDGNEVQRLAAAVDAFVWYASLGPA